VDRRLGHDASHELTDRSLLIGYWGLKTGETAMGIGRRDAEHMRRMRARRRPFTAPRAGRLLSQIEFAFFFAGIRGKPSAKDLPTAMPTSELVRCCFPVEHMWGEIKSWHRTSVIRAARLVATPIGRASTRGRPLLWQAVPERMKERGLFLTHRTSSS
jgi:hypothetical protein